MPGRANIQHSTHPFPSGLKQAVRDASELCSRAIVGKRQQQHNRSLRDRIPLAVLAGGEDFLMMNHPKNNTFHGLTVCVHYYRFPDTDSATVADAQIVPVDPGLGFPKLARIRLNGLL